MLVELGEFKKTSLFRHFQDHYNRLYNGTVDQILEERLQGPETLYVREGWIGEARAVRLQADWFDILKAELEEKLRALES